MNFIPTVVRTAVSPIRPVTTSHCDMIDARGPCCNTFLPTPDGMRVCEPNIPIQTPTVSKPIDVTVVNPPVNNNVNWTGSTVPSTVSHSGSSPFIPMIHSQSIPHHTPPEVVITPQVVPVLDNTLSNPVSVVAVTLHPVKISSLPGINSSSTVLEARIAAAKYLKTEVQKVFLAYASQYNPRGAKDELLLSNYGMGSRDLFFYHSVPVEQTLIPNPVPGLVVPKVFKYEDLKIPYGSTYVGPHVCFESYQYSDFLYCQHPSGSIHEKTPIGTGQLSDNWVGRHSYGHFDVVIKVKYNGGDYTPFSIETAPLGTTVPECGKYGPSVYILKR